MTNLESVRKVAFDVDDTLLVAAKNSENTPNYPVIAIYKWFQSQGCEMIIWSGSGVDWAKRWGEKLGVEPFSVRVKEKFPEIDIAFDDCDVDLGKVNIRVK